MNFLVVDDERYAREEMETLLRETRPDSVAYCCGTVEAALEYVEKERVDVAFLDIELGAANGILLAKQLKDRQPGLHIIFTTSYSQYAVDAFSVHATGYLLKPVRKEQIERELTFLYGESKYPEKQVMVQTFDGFEVFVNGNRLNFRRQKSKELLAYLVMRRGAGITIREACAILFEDAVYDRSRKGHFHTILSELKSVLKQAGVENILVKSYNNLAINSEKIDCDYYRFLCGDVQVINSYHGEFLPSYSWAEFAIAELDARQTNYLKMFELPGLS